MMRKESMKLALEAYMAAGFGNSTDFALQKKAYDLTVKALAEQPAQQEPSDLDVWKARALQAEAVVAKFMAPQPAQHKPVAWTLLLVGAHNGLVGKAGEKFIGHPKHYDRVDVYTFSPAQRKPLTDEEIEAVWKRVQANDFHDCVQPFARAIEAAHGIKENT